MSVTASGAPQCERHLDLDVNHLGKAAKFVDSLARHIKTKALFAGNITQHQHGLHVSCWLHSPCRHFGAKK
jgi:hypothetical protein